MGTGVDRRELCPFCDKVFWFPSYKVRIGMRRMKRYSRSFTKAFKTDYLDPVCPHCSQELIPESIDNGGVGTQ